MFTKRHEQEIAEIKGLTYELGARLEEIVEQLERIREVQEQLIHDRSAGERAPAADDPATSEPTPQAVAKASAEGRTRQGAVGWRRQGAAGQTVAQA